MNANVLAVCTEGGIGDLLAAAPAMRAIARHAQAPVTVLASEYAAPVLQDEPAVREVLYDDPRSGPRELGARIAPYAFSHAVVFWSTARVADAMRRAGIPHRIGQARRLYSRSYTTQVPVRTERGDTTTHWTDVQMDYARAFGAQPQPVDFVQAVRLRPHDELEARRVLDGAGVVEPFAVLHAARGIPLERVRWPIESFAAIGDAMGSAFGIPVVLTGGDAERNAIAQIDGRMRNPRATIAGKTSIMGLASVLARAALVVALDSGPMHIAAALGTPTVGVFALRTDLPDRWRPLGPRVAVIRPSYPCPSWHRKETCRTFECYARLAPEAVVAAARAICRPHTPATPAA